MTGRATKKKSQKKKRARQGLASEHGRYVFGKLRVVKISALPVSAKRKNPIQVE
jgi:hypothetical protein